MKMQPSLERALRHMERRFGRYARTMRLPEAAEAEQKKTKVKSHKARQRSPRR
jgi:HSP20 family molecular chaperone IbpA